MDVANEIDGRKPAQQRERKQSCTAKPRWVTSCCFLVLSILHFLVIPCCAFVPVTTKKITFVHPRYAYRKLSAIYSNDRADDGFQSSEEEEVQRTRRRTAIFASSSLVAQLLVRYAAPSNAATTPLDLATSTVDPTLDVNFDCLQDLPPIPRDCVRIYLCRHGQTENNRLRKVQGARVDPPINDNGITQAINLGKTLSQVQPCPKMVFHSSLLRAKMTAETAAEQIDSSITTKILPALGEVDFGPVAEGQPVSMAKAGMQLTYGAWALGNIDYRPDQGGETGREVGLRRHGEAKENSYHSRLVAGRSLKAPSVPTTSHISHTILRLSSVLLQVFTRAAEALMELAAAAKKSNDCIVAVSHSTYLRMLLAVVLDEPLLETAARTVSNGSITVIDVKKDLSPRSSRKLTMKSKMFNGPAGIVQKRSSQEVEFELKLPICNVVRINEVRHLPVL